MLKTGFTVIPITDDYTIELKNVTSLRIVQDQTCNQRVIVNGIPLIDRIENLLLADGTVCPELSLHIQFQENLIPTANPVKLIYVQFRKLLTEKCANHGG